MAECSDQVLRIIIGFWPQECAGGPTIWEEKNLNPFNRTDDREFTMIG